MLLEIENRDFVLHQWTQNRPLWNPIMCIAPFLYLDLNFIYQLTEEFCQNHFLTGLLLREVGMALHDVTEVRQHGIKVLRNLLAKHSMDDRYSSKVGLSVQGLRYYTKDIKGTISDCLRLRKNFQTL